VVDGGRPHEPVDAVADLDDPHVLVPGPPVADDCLHAASSFLSVIGGALSVGRGDAGRSPI
jgi:hypothetical protein